MSRRQAVLHDVGRIHAGGQPGVHPVANHGLQARSKPLKQLLPGSIVTGFSAVQQVIGVVVSRVRHRPGP
jgi:hypothetical protein